MHKSVSKYSILFILAVLFAAPGIGAYLLYQHPNWLGTAKINKGTLLAPPILLGSIGGNHKWSVIFWQPGLCSGTCLQQLDTLARMRLALGRKLYQVDQWLIFSDKTPLLSERDKGYLNQIEFKTHQLTATEIVAQGDLFSKAKVFIADPNHYLILSYPIQSNPEDIYKDLRLLLNTSEIKKG